MSLVVSVGGKIESYYSFKNENLSPVQKSSNLKKVEAHDQDEKKETALKSESNKKAIINDSYGKQPRKVPIKRSVILARDIMISPVRMIKKSATVHEAIVTLEKFNNKHLLISENEMIVGIISDRDLLRASANKNYHTQKIEEIMSKNVILAKTYTDIKLLAGTMLSENISSLPIIDDEHRLQGIVTHTDLLLCIVKNMPLDILI